MDLKNQLTKTPYLVLFIILITVGVGTASALITITLAGDVIITDSLHVDTDTLVVDSVTNNVGIHTVNPIEELDVDGDVLVRGNLYLGTENPNDNDGIFFDDGTEFIFWSVSKNQFEMSTGLRVSGPIHAEGLGSLVPFNSMGDFPASNHGLDSYDDLKVGDDLEVGGKIFADGGVSIVDGLSIVGNLGVQATGTPAVFDRTGSDGPLVIFDRDGVGKGSISISGETVSYNAFTGSHYAWTGEEMKRGLLVSMNGDNKYLNDNPNNEILYGVEISQTKNDSAILGTYLSVLDTSVVASLDNPLLITSEGNGKVWVAYTGEEIKPGDYLISSAVSGHAMKDDRAEEVSHIIGRAAEPIVWDEVTETVDDVKHKKISILFNFVPLNNQILD